ncbi:DsbC family protein [Polynucleobacter paneuropaeus]|nr:DsbC family protein [Polynucleobacter paneuropaeus]
MNKLLNFFLCITLSLGFASLVSAQTEQKIKAELQGKLGSNTKIKSVTVSPIAGIYEVQVGNDVFYTDVNSKYLLQGEIIEVATGKNITEQRQNDLNRIKWADLPSANAIKIVHGNGNRQLAIFADPNCGYCKRLEKSLQQLDNVTIYTYLIPILSADSVQKSKQIWCASDSSKTYVDWMINGTPITGKNDCNTVAIDKNLSLAKTLGITGTPTIFFVDGSRFPGAAQLTDIEKKFSSLK